MAIWIYWTIFGNSNYDNNQMKMVWDGYKNFWNFKVRFQSDVD